MSEHDPEAQPEPRPNLFRPTPDPAPVPEPVVIDHAPAPPRRGGTPLPLTLLLVAALGGATYWTWTHPQRADQAGAPAADPQPAIEAARAQLAQQIQAISARVDALEKQPAPAPAAPPADGDAAVALSKKLDDLSGRVDALSGKQDQMAAEAAKQAEIAAQKPPPAPESKPDQTAQEVPGLIAQQQAADLGKLNDTVAQQKAAVAQAQSDAKAAADAQAAQKAALDQLIQRLAKLEQESGQAQAAADAQAAQKAGIDQLTQRLAKLEQESGQAQAAAASQANDTTALAALDSRVGKLEQGAGQAQGAVTGAAKDATRAIRIEAAEAALQAGQPLGTLPDAPPALTRFATTPPPTESALRADFNRVAEAARAVSQPDVAKKSFVERMFARVQQTVVVRQGDQVIVGDPAAGILARAQDHMAAGDLKGAADTLADLRGPAADAVRDWVGKVRALLEARAALASLAARG